MKGKVKFYDRTKQFGFITSDEDSKDYFVHESGLMLEEGDSLNDGDSVSFDVEQGPRGPKAVNVKKASEDEQSEPANEELQEAA